MVGTLTNTTGRSNWGLSLKKGRGPPKLCKTIMAVLSRLWIFEHTCRHEKSPRGNFHPELCLHHKGSPTYWASFSKIPVDITHTDVARQLSPNNCFLDVESPPKFCKETYSEDSPPNRLHFRKCFGVGPNNPLGEIKKLTLICPFVTFKPKDFFFES